MRTSKRRWIVWLCWGAISVAAGVYLAAGLLSESAATTPWLATSRKLMLPGQTSHGHHQIELACEACHASPFGGPEVLQQACEGCHAADLKDANDKHPLTKFLDPRNAELLEKLDARWCVTCHVEHRPEITHAMGVTQPRDFCFHCHQDIATERPSHEGMGFETCASAGCHNFHDNRALYEDFLVRHADAPAMRADGSIAMRDFLQVASMLPDYPSDEFPLNPLDLSAADAPAGHGDAGLNEDWLASRHAQAGVNCSACHGATAAAWVARPDHNSCKTCHQPETKGFLAGKHGMRIARGLSPMTPADALIPMKQGASHETLTCTTCHGAHRFDTRIAAVEACLGCHDDKHSRAFKSSPHFALSKAARADEKAGTAVTCATCHMPRIDHRVEALDLKRVLVQHNQSDTLRPNEKMLRTVCMHCHGLGYSIDALADEDLVRSNFAGRPKRHVRSIDMSVERVREAEEKQGDTQTGD